MVYTGKGFKQLTEENIFEKITEFDIFSYYIVDFTAINKSFSSPFRSDKAPSCRIQEWEGTLFYKDFGNNVSYTCINFVRAKFNATYFEALTIISNDFDLGLASKSVDKQSMGFIGLHNAPIKTVEKTSILKIKRRCLNNTIDKEYWSQWGWKPSTLHHFNVVPLSHLWVNNNCITIKKNNPSYAYVLGEGKYKILSPYSEYKWINNCNSEDIQGWNQLPETGELLIITSSLKDVGTLYEYGYIAISPQSENTLISIDKMSELKERFDRIVVFFDNDEPGIEAAELYESLFEVDYTHTPETYSKDISDTYRDFGDIETKKLLKKLLNN